MHVALRWRWIAGVGQAAAGQAAPVKFLRHLAAATATVGVVVLLGLAWNRFKPSLPGEGPGGRALVVRGQVVKGLPPGHAVSVSFKLPAGAKPVPGLHINDAGGIPGLQLGDLLKAATSSCCGTPPSSRWP